MNRTLLRFRLKHSLPGAAFALGGLILFGLLMCGAYQAFGMDRNLAEALPGSEAMLRAMLGERGALMWDLTSFLAMAWRHPIVLAVIAGMAASYGSAFLAREVGDGTADLLFSRPVTRSRLFWNDLAVSSGIMAAVTVLFSLSLWVAASAMGLSPPGVAQFFRAGVLTLAFALALLAVAYLVGSLLSDGRRAMAISAALFIAMYMVDAVGTLWDRVEPLRPLSLFAYFTPLDSLKARPEGTGNAIILFAVAAAAVALSHVVAGRRDL
ncbi:MAG: ABC transporter permease subunit [Bacillota bacterium]|nr:ABC transporter permease subunit [Bacillota bacterium]